MAGNQKPSNPAPKKGKRHNWDLEELRLLDEVFPRCPHCGVEPDPEQIRESLINIGSLSGWGGLPSESVADREPERIFPTNTEYLKKDYKSLPDAPRRASPGAKSVSRRKSEAA